MHNIFALSSNATITIRKRSYAILARALTIYVTIQNFRVRFVFTNYIRFEIYHRMSHRLFYYLMPTCLDTGSITKVKIPI